MKPRIQVVGVGGAGGNAVNNMIAAGLKGPEFIVANTDAQALTASSAEKRIQLGASLTEGLGAGSKPEIGEAAAEEAVEEIRNAVKGAHMVFVAAGMGGGTGTGAASVIARVAREFGILTVAVVTKPFTFEGSRRMRVAELGIAELKRHVDTLLVIPNQNLFRLANDRTTFAEAFLRADQVLYSGIACIVDLVVREGLINLDLADVKTVLSGMGTAMMGTGEASGEQRATLAAEAAIVNPLLDEVTLRGAKSLLLSITGGPDLTLWEVDEVANRVRQEVDPDANIIVGATFDETLRDKVRVSIVASGMARHGVPHPGRQQPYAGSVPPPLDMQAQIAEAMGQAQPRATPPNAHPQVRGHGVAWQAPDGVYIQERPPQLASASLATSGANRASNSQERTGDARAAAGGYSRPPMPIAGGVTSALRSAREYWSRADHDAQSDVPEADQSEPQSASDPGEKVSLLRRIANVGRGRRGRSDRSDGGGSEVDQPHIDQPVESATELPVFFGRGKGGQGG